MPHKTTLKQRARFALMLGSILSISSGAFAQITLNRANNEPKSAVELKTSFRAQSHQDLQAMIAKTGGDQIYDFSVVTYSKWFDWRVERAPYVSEVTGKDDPTFSSANYVSAMGHETSLDPDISDCFSFFSIEDTGSTLLGGCGNVYDPPYLEYPFPLEFGASWTNNLSGSIQTSKVDGWGTLVTPAGTEPCLRILRTQFEENFQIFSVVFITQGKISAEFGYDSFSGEISYASYDVTHDSSADPGNDPPINQPVSGNWSVGFEDGFRDWLPEGAVWETGVPTFGPEGAYEGQAVAGTILDGNYSETSNEARLISPAFTVPPTEENPRLSYHQWYSFGASDSGRLQVRATGGQWEDVPNEAVIALGTAWSRRNVDLRAYADLTIQVAFHFLSADTVFSPDSGPGWYLDDVRLETGPMTFNSPEGFESGFGDWSAEGGVWQVGAPDSGPAAAFLGEGVAATILGGNYSGSDYEARLVSPQFIVPASDETPRLSYQQWYSFGASDSGRLQVRAEGGQWEDTPNGVISSRGTSWSRGSVDLSAYAGQAIQVAFQFLSIDTVLSPDNGPGWYLDDVRLESGPITFNSPEGFESGFGNWSAEGGIWQVGVPASDLVVAFEGEAVAATIVAGNYSSSDDEARLVSPRFTVPPVNESPRLSYHQWYSFGAWDSGQLQVRTVGGQWEDIPDEVVFSRSTSWSRGSVDLSAYVGQAIQVAFHFVSVDTVFSQDSGPGWYVDDVRLETGPMTLNSPEGFESGFGDWSTEGGVWQVGATASDLVVAFEGEAVAGTILGGNYSSSDDEARLVSPRFTVPAATETPRFTYRQWYSFGASDSGRLQIRNADGQWENVPNEVVFSRATSWSRGSVDLRSYAGQKIQLAFQFISVDTVFSSDSGPGWYVDDVRLETGPMTLNNPEGFEAGFGDWSMVGGVWNIGVPTSGPSGAFEGESVAGTNLEGNYPNRTESRLVSPEFRVPSAFTAPQVSIREWQAIRTGDTRTVQVRVSGGDWSNLPDLSGSSSGSWERRTWDITPYASQNIQFGFLLSANNSGTDAGWYLDQFSLETLDPNVLEFGGSFSGYFPTAGSRALYALEVPAGGHFLFNLDDLDDVGLNEVYLRREAVATAGNYDYKFSGNGADHSVFVPDAGAGTWFILAIGADVSDGDNQYSINVDFSEGIALRSIAPSRVSNSATAPLSITGAGFDNTTKAELRMGGNAVRNGEVERISSSQLTVFVNATDLPVGLYDLVIDQGGNSQSMPIEVFEGGQPNLEAKLIVPERVGRHALATIFVEYANTGTAPMPAPLFTVSGSNNALLTLDSSLAAQGLWTSAKPIGFDDTVQILGSGGTPGVLQPGEKMRVPVTYAGLLQPWNFNDGSVEFDLGIFTSDTDATVDWTSLKDQMRPNSMDADSWHALWFNFVNGVGPTWGEYAAMLSENAMFLARLGIQVTDVGQLLGFELMQADGLGVLPMLSASTDAFVPQPGLELVFSRSFPSSLSQRNSKSTLGYGWTHNWTYELTVESNGTVISTGPQERVRVFQPDSRGGYFVQNGEFGKLQKLDSGKFEISEPSGIRTEFGADGKLAGIEDLNGNRITARYSNDLLVRLEHSSGGFLQFTYEGDLVRSITDSLGKTVSYDYAPGAYLSSVKGNTGLTVGYSYNVSGEPSVLHSLSTVTSYDGRVQEFSYDSEGRIAQVNENGGAWEMRFTYDQPGRVIIEDLLGSRILTYFNQRGQISKIVDALGGTTRVGYDSHYDLTTAVAPDGATTRMNYDREGNPVAVVDPLGNELITEFDGNGRLSSIRDARGNLTEFEYDSDGNITSAIYADGSREQYDYDENGLITALTNRRGQTIRLTYDDYGRTIRKETPEGRSYDYSWDQRGNLLQVIDSELGTTSLTHNERNLLTNMEYPDEQWLKIEYDRNNRRTLLEQSNGAIQRYEYDHLGRLERLLDGSGSLIVEYGYDAAGQIIEEHRGNNTSTTYAYAPTGAVQSIVHIGSNDNVLSRFDYAYNANGNRISESSSKGQTTYRYDSAEQLQWVKSPNGSETTFDYDETGNRTRIVTGGVEKNYQVNELNRYTTVGGDVLEYDADENLVKRIAASGTTVYEYDSENRLTSIQSPTSSLFTFTYDSLGRVGEISSDESTKTLRYDPESLGRVIAEIESSLNPTTTTTTTTVIQGHGPVSETSDSGNTDYFTYDQDGNVRHILGQDGLVVNEFDYGSPEQPRVPSEDDVPHYAYRPPWGGLSDPSMYPEGISPSDPFQRSFIKQGDDITLSLRDRLRNLSPVDPFPNLPGSNLFAAVGVITDFVAASKFRAGHWVKSSIPYEKLVGRVAAFGNVASSVYKTGLRSHRTLLEAGNLAAIETAILGLARFGLVHPLWAMAASFVVPPLYEGIVTTAMLVSNFLAEIVPSLKLGNILTGIANAFDPNEMIGPAGYGPANFLSTTERFAYRINFENLEEATAPAQVVEIRNPLPDGLNVDSLEFTSVGFGDLLIPIPAEAQRFEHKQWINVTGVEFNVNIELSVDYTAREVKARFSSVMPETLLPPPVEIGFLPPEDGSGRGKGYIEYIVHPSPELTTGTEIRNIGFVTFDRLAGGPTFRTDLSDLHDPNSLPDLERQALVTIDADGPTSTITALPWDYSMPNFNVGWSGNDLGSGVTRYDIYVQTDGSDWDVWLLNTTTSSAVWQGEFDKTYRFYAAAQDGVGFHEEPPGHATSIDRLVEVRAGKDGTYSIGDFVITVKDQDNPMINGSYHEATLDPREIHRWTFRAKVGNEIRLWAENIDPPSGLQLWLGALAPDGTLIDLNGTSIDALLPFIADQEGDYTVLVADIDADGTGPDRNDDSGPYRIRLRKLAPDLVVPEAQFVNELETLTVEVFSRDPDDFNKPLEFNILSAPEGVSLQSVGNTNAVVSWTPNEDQGPGVYEITASVTDVVDGVAWVDEQRFGVTVQEINTPPQFEPVDTLTIDELQSLDVTLAVRDDDAPKYDLTFALVQAPEGMVIDPGSGAISWIPTETQGPGDFEVVAQVTDTNTDAVNAEQLGSTITFNAIVTEINQTPTLSLTGAQTVTEGTALSVAITAVDTDFPENELVYSLVAPPDGALIASTTGMLTWTPSEEMGGLTTEISVQVTDGGGLSATQAFQVTVEDENSPPVLNVPNDPILFEELTSGTIQVTATDTDIPKDTLIYSMANAPDGMTINSQTGLIEWTPDASHGGSSASFSITVVDGGNPSLKDTKTLTLAVGNAPALPVLTLPSNTIVDELSPYLETVSVTNASELGNTISYALIKAPDGAAINSATGAISWTPSEAQGPGTHSFTVKVSGDSELIGSFAVQVNEVNATPQLSDIKPQPVDELSSLTIELSASDSDEPANALAYALVEAPEGATVDSKTGIVSWTPSEAQGPEEHNFVVQVSDNQNPPISNQASFTVVVNEVNTAPVPTSIAAFSHPAGVPLVLPLTAEDEDEPANSLTFALEEAPPEMTIKSEDNTLRWTPSDQDIETSATIVFRVTDDGNPALTNTERFQITVTGRTPPDVIPLLTLPDNAAVDELSPFQGVVGVTNASQLGENISYAFVDAPSGAAIDPVTGAISWTPSEAQGPGTHSFTITASGESELNGSFDVQVTEVNTAPEIATIPNFSLPANSQLMLPIIATDSDQPANTLSFRLDNAPAGMSIGASDGVLIWFPADADIGTSPTVSVRVTDNGEPGLSAMAAFQISVTGIPVEYDYPDPSVALSGAISGRLGPSGSTFLVTEDLVIPEGEVLIIEPGVTIKFRDASNGLIVAGELIASGTKELPVLFTSDNKTKGAGQWQGIVFLKSSSPSSTLSNCVIEYAGTGINLTEAGPILESCKFIGHSGHAISMDPLSFPTMRDNTASGNGSNSTEIRGGRVATSGTWMQSGIPYTITSDVEINADATLTIQPGTTVQFRDSNDGLFVLGTLIADASTGQPIVFTSDNTSKGSGQWQRINLSQGDLTRPSILRNCVIEYGGASGGQTVLVEAANPVIEACVIRGSVGDGLSLRSSNARISGVRFEQNRGFAVAMDTASFPVIDGSVAEGNGSNSIAISGGTVSTSGVWQFPGIPYTITDDVLVGNESSLTVAPGNVIQFRDTNDALIVDGILHSIGRSDRPIIFTSDDTSKGPGQWEALIFNGKESSDPSVLDHCLIEYGGASGVHMIESFTSALQIQNSTIQSSVGVGINLRNSSPVLNAIRVLGNRGVGIQASSGSQPVIRQSTIINNEGLGIRNNDLSVIIDARENYWGDPTGPRDRADEDGLGLFNPDSNGQAVSEYVDWSSPLTSEFVPPDEVENPEPHEVELIIDRFSESQIRIIWATTEPVGQLETTPSLNALESWTIVDALPIQDGDRWTLVLPATENQQYFRLSPTP